MLAAGAAVAPGKAPARFARAARRAASAARTHAREVTVQDWLEGAAGGLPGDDAFVAGWLAGRRHGAGDEALAGWTDALSRLLRGKATDWLETGSSV